MGRLLALAAAFAVVLAAGGASAAGDLPIKAFFGVWKGNAISESEISANFRVTARDLDVEIQGFAVGGFTLRWATVLRQEGDPNAPAEVLKEATVTFIPQPGRTGVWRASESQEPLAGAYLWARMEGQTLSVYSLGIAEDGSSDLQVYRRTLGGNGMELEFTRSIDGASIRTARGRLIKYSN
ncbi:MAG: hypothetical protein VYB54_07825 [Pseudomonadota bacterium]|nr:hypothetical protein [Pseudomonadota bacterium]